MISPKKLSEILAAGTGALSDRDLSTLVDAYRMLLALRDRAKSTACNPWELMRALALLGAEKPEAWTLDELFETNGSSGNGRSRI